MHPYSRSWGQGYTSAHVADKCIPGRRICGNIWRWAVGWLRLRHTSPASIALTDRGSRHRSSSTCSRCTTSSRRLIRWTSFFRSSTHDDAFRSAVINFTSRRDGIGSWARNSKKKKNVSCFTRVFFIGVCNTHVATRVPFFRFVVGNDMWRMCFEKLFRLLL